jgi:hypothetical protein
MKEFFGVRWAYHLQDQILGQKLSGVVFPSLAAGLRNQDQEFVLAMARDRAQRIQEQNHNAQQTRLLADRKYDDSPAWAVPDWFGEKPKMTLPSPKEIMDFHNNADEMKLYAMRMPFMREP